MTDGARPVGMIAGDGPLPTLAAKRLKKRGREVFVCYLEEPSSQTVSEIAREEKRLNPKELESVPQFFLENDVEDLYLVGNVDKTSLYEEQNIAEADGAVLNILDKLPNKGDEYLIRAATKYLSSKGLSVLGLDSLFEDNFMPAGHVAGPDPTKETLNTIETLKPVARSMADMEVGQTVIGKKQSVVAVEGVEGTQQVIERAGELAGSGCVMMKGARSDQDTRYDVPVIGLDTLKQLSTIEATALAVEANKVLWLQQEKSREMAEKSAISVIGFEHRTRGILGRLSQWLSE